MKQEKQNGLVWSGLVWSVNDLVSSLVWSGWESCGIGTWTKWTISATWHTLRASPRLSLCGWSLITPSVFGSGYPKSAYIIANHGLHLHCGHH